MTPCILDVHQATISVAILDSAGKLLAWPTRIRYSAGAFVYMPRNAYRQALSASARRMENG
jgi:hypothetical protein